METLTIKNQIEIKQIAKNQGHLLTFKEAKKLYSIANPDTRLYLNRYLPENLVDACKDIPLNSEFNLEDFDYSEEYENLEDFYEVGGCLYTWNQCVEYGFVN